MESATMHLLLELSRFTALAFVSALWQGCAMIAAVALCLRLLPRLSAAVRFSVWTFAFALLATIPLLHASAAAGLHPYPPSAMVHVGAGFGLAIAGIWAAFTTFRAGRLLVQAAHLRRIWRRAVPVASGDTFEMPGKSRRSAVLCTSTDVDSPSVIGFASPRLLIPEWMFAQLTEAELRQVVLHECEHLRRHDDWLNLLQKIVLMLFPLNPALLWVDRRLSVERELACDAGVVASIAAPFDYANCLTRLAEYRMVRRRVALSLSAWNRQSELAYRVSSLLRPMHRISKLRARLSVGLLSLGLVAGSVGMARAPRLISFTDSVAAPVNRQAVGIAMPDAVHTTAAAYRQTRWRRPKLLKTVRTDTETLQQLKPVTQADVPLQRVPASRYGVRKRRQPHVLLAAARQPVANTSAGFVSRAFARPAYAVAIDFSPSYAAIPYGDGWLLVQL